MKKRLFTPGPTPVPESIMLRMAEPIIHHRSPEFNQIVTRLNQNLKYLFQTEHPVLTLTCSGTGGMESTFVSLFSPGDTIISVNGGKFGERWVKMPRTFGLDVEEVKIEWGKAPTEEMISGALTKRPNAKAVYLTHNETSTGTATDIRHLADVIRKKSNALVCVDGISAVGAMEMRFDEWGIDVCVTGSQKGLMVPPGLAFAALSSRAIAALENSRLPRFYFDLKKALRSYEKNDTPWTPAITLAIGAEKALELIREEGIEQVWKRHSRIARAVRAGIKGLGLKLFSESPSGTVTAVWVPEGMEWKHFNAILKSKYGVTIAGGQDSYAGRIFRISHMGYCDELDVLAAIGALEMALNESGYTGELGRGIAAVQKELSTT